MANTYHWLNGIGAVKNRAPGRSYAGALVPSDFGTDEFIKLCQADHLSAIVTVNVSDGAEKAANWVEYFNGAVSTTWGAKRAANGNPAPLNVIYWEIGNELYSPKERGHATASNYAKQVIAFATAMKRLDPNIKIGADLEASFTQAAWMKSYMPSLVTWNKDVLRIAGPSLDFVVIHFYAPFDTLWSEDSLHQLVWAGPDVFEQNLDRIRALLKQYAKPGIPLAITEYGTFFGSKTAPKPRIASTENGLFDALMLLACIRAPDIAAANNWSLLNNSAFGMMKTSTNGLLAVRPTYDVFRLLGGFAGMRTVPVEVKTGGYSVNAKGNIPSLAKVNDLSVAAAKDESGGLKLAIVNRDTREAAQATLAFSGGSPRSLSVVSLTSGSGDTTAWRHSAAKALTPQPDGSYVYTFPPQSLSVLTGTTKAP